MNTAIRLSYLRAAGFIKDRVNYAQLKMPYTCDWTKYIWSLQTNYTCNYNCSYCIQAFGMKEGRDHLKRIPSLKPEEFLKLNSLEDKLDEKIGSLSIQGGEPLLYAGLPDLLKGFRIFKNISVISNLSQNIKPYIRLAPHFKNATIKFVASFHPEYSDLEQFIGRATRLKDSQLLDYVDFVDSNWGLSLDLMKRFEDRGIPVKPFRFVGLKEDKIHPRRAEESCSGRNIKTVACYSPFVLIAPDGKVFNCHAKMYRDSEALCTVKNFPQNYVAGYHNCNEYGKCHPCQMFITRTKRLLKESSVTQLHNDRGFNR